MPMPKEALIQDIKEAFPDAVIQLTALVEDNDHYQLDIKSDHFKGLSRIKQHQAVYKALKGKMGTDLHALALTTSSLT